MRVISVLQHCICHLFACVIENGERTGASKRPCYRCFFLFAQSLSTSVWQCWKEKKEWAIRASIVSWWPLSNCDREFENSWNGLDYIYKWHEGPDNILSFAMNLKKKTHTHTQFRNCTYIHAPVGLHKYIYHVQCVCKDEKESKTCRHPKIHTYCDRSISTDDAVYLCHIAPQRFANHCANSTHSDSIDLGEQL